MPGKLYFEIPEDSEVMARLVESIPNDWSWVDGTLDASRAPIDAGEVLKNTGLLCDRFSINRLVVPRDRKEKADLFGILVDRKRPGFVSFREAGYDSHDFPLVLAKQFAAAFLNMAYRGWLTFFLNDYDNNKYDNGARCNFTFQPWTGASMCGMNEEVGPQPPRVKLEWNENYGGQPLDISPIESVCRELGLKEYTPKAMVEV